MNKWYRSRIVKAILILLANISVFTLVICVWWAASYHQIFMDVLEGAGNKTYEESSEFYGDFYIESMDVVQWITNRELFMTEGQENLDKIVDIQEFNDNTTISNKDTSGFSYRLGDLLDWYDKLQSGAYDSYETNPDGVRKDAPIVCKRADGTFHYYDAAQFRELIMSNSLQFADYDNDRGLAQTEILDEIESGFTDGHRGILDDKGEILYVNCWQYDGNILEGDYKPLNADSVMDIVNDNPEWNGRLSDAYDMLENTVLRLGEMYKDYDELSSRLREGDTNYFYLYANTSTGQIYTNKAEFSNYDKLDASIKAMQEMGCYVVVKPHLSDFQSNIRDIGAAGWRDTIAETGGFGNDFVFAAAVDTNYPIQDRFYSAAYNFEKNIVSVQRAVACMIPALLCFIISVFWLMAVAGRSNIDEELHLCAFDRWKTEISAALIIALWIVPVAFAGYTGIYGAAADVMTVIVLPMLGIYTCSMFLIGILSLVRRIKAGIVWKNSLLRGFGKFAKTVFGNWSSVWRLILVYGVFVVIHWLAVIAAGCGTIGLGFFVAVIAEILAFVYLVYNAIGRDRISRGIRKIAGGEIDYQIATGNLRGEQKRIAEEINCIGEGLDAAVEKSMKSERLKTDLITNVSHDIKTPLTSIINYVELLKQENFEDPKIQRYIEVLEAKSQRLKTLTEDVVEASKVSSGNITLEYMNINLVEMIQQTSGEFAEKFEARNLTEVLSLPNEEAVIRVDGRRMWRVLENIYNNAAKYAMEGTRVYADLQIKDNQVIFSLKNISKQPLNISADELTERFIRGDISRSTEGSGLGLSIAKTLTEMQGGKFELYLDGDLFKVTIMFKVGT
ncbi:sensor histidine kinase [Faecalicatena contorta]|uniref:sensor histidine kinase n=1 Tax=Faecalicatena contorta TaxID=39482 RepID=UPI001F186E51|nr:HAMP domain-containing sensor histidine kinase [Faecalicatena contorta]MCF2553926.1 HAMP domain-containing histidine kinase [Faecalicatena contorta]MCF2680653.1 HAMP domain-containing histidine kinase [Faecalicatena contorta]